MSYWATEAGQNPLGGLDMKAVLEQAAQSRDGAVNGGSVLVNGKWVMPQYGNARWEGTGENAVLVAGEPTEYWIADDLGKSSSGGYGGGGSAQYEGKPYHRVDAQGNYLGSNNYKDMGTDGFTKIGAWLSALGGAAVAGGAITGAMATGTGGAGAAGGAGGFIGEGAASGIGGWDAALAGAGQGTGAAAGGAGGFIGEGAASGIPAWDGAAGASGASAAGGAAGGFTPPTAPGLGAPAAAGSGLSLGGGAGAVGSVLPGLSNLAGPAAALIGGAVSAGAAGDAADQQAKASLDALALQERMFNKVIELNEPFRATGVQAVNRLGDLTGISGRTGAEGYGDLMRDFSMETDYLQDPGYQHRLAEGNRALERRLAAGGQLYSGKALKDTITYNQGEASQEFGNSWNRWNTTQGNKFNRLASLSGAGQTATNQVGGAAQNYGQTGGAALQNAGNAQAGGTVGRANALADGISQGYSMYQDQVMTDRVMRARGY